jgi:hypothetical protein
MKRFLKLPTYHWIIVFFISGFFAIAFAFSTYNLFHLSMANLDFVKEFGIEALKEGALFQTFEILVGASFSLICYMGFKICESELVSRYNSWKTR